MIAKEDHHNGSVVLSVSPHHVDDYSSGKWTMKPDGCVGISITWAGHGFTAVLTPEQAKELADDLIRSS